MEQKFIIITNPNSSERAILNTDHVIEFALKLEVGTGKQQVSITLVNEKTYTVDMPHEKIIKIIKPIDPVEEKAPSAVGFQIR